MSPPNGTCETRNIKERQREGDRCRSRGRHYFRCGGDTAIDNVSSPKPRSCGVYSRDIENRAGDNGGTVRGHQELFAPFKAVLLRPDGQPARPYFCPSPRVGRPSAAAADCMTEQACQLIDDRLPETMPGASFRRWGLRACGGGAKRQTVGDVPRSGPEPAAGRAM
jgi:hypothetical protein